MHCINFLQNFLYVHYEILEIKYASFHREYLKKSKRKKTVIDEHMDEAKNNFDVILCYWFLSQQKT